MEKLGERRHGFEVMNWWIYGMIKEMDGLGNETVRGIDLKVVVVVILR
jgi:hypothetical protein